MFTRTFLVLACVLGSKVVAAQEPSPPIPVDVINRPASEEPISPKRLITNILYDQKPIFTFPLRAVRGEHWKAVLGVTLVTAGLVALDPHTERFFHDRSDNSFQTGPLRGRNTTLAVTLTPAAFYLIGLGKHSMYAKNIGLLAVEVVADMQILSFVTKQAIGRLKPSDIAPGGNLRDTWFKYKSHSRMRAVFPRVTRPPHLEWQP